MKKHGRKLFKILVFSTISCLTLAILFGGFVGLGAIQARHQQKANADEIPESLANAESAEPEELYDIELSEFAEKESDVYSVSRIYGGLITVIDDRGIYTVSLAGVNLTDAGEQFLAKAIGGTRIKFLSSVEDGNIGYVYLPDGTMLQELLLYRGLASVDGNYREHLAEFVALEDAARLAKVGIWAN